MEKVHQSHGSPDCVISMDKTPPVVGGRLEKFGSITNMISQWEGMEENEEGSKDDLSVDKRGRKRLSKVIRELSGRFAEGEKHISQPGDECEGEWENVLQVRKGGR